MRLSRLELLTGKGGVGRSTVSLALARAAVQRGESVLLLEAEEGPERAAALGRLIGVTMSGEARQVEPRLWLAQLRALEGHASFLKELIPAGPLIQAALSSKALRRFLESAPAMYELGLFQQLWCALQDQRFDRVILDLPATGHALALLQLPEQLQRLLNGGPLVDRLMRGRAGLAGSDRTRLWIVTRPEQTVISEALELAQQLKEDGLSPSGFLVNGWSRLPLNDAETEQLGTLLACAPKSDEAIGLRRHEEAPMLLARLGEVAATYTLPLRPAPSSERPPPAWYQPLCEALQGLFEGGER
ncbi:MAG: ArsA family ATPase [Myxococcota bacterium]|nr:ArsA family ATPase [Myxococcota bacterium]